MGLQDEHGGQKANGETMADQFPHPLMGILLDLFATQKGQQVAKDATTVIDGLKQADSYAMAAPERIYEQATDGRMPTPGEVISTAGDLALLLGSVGALGRTGGRMLAKKGSDWVKAPPLPKQGPTIPKDAATYTDRHSALAQAELRKLLSVPDKNLSHKTLKEAYLKRLNKAHNLNVGPQGQQLDDMVTETLRRVPTTTKLNSPGSVEWAVQRSTGHRKAGAPLTMGLAGAAAASNEDIEALLAEIMGGSK